MKRLLLLTLFLAIAIPSYAQRFRPRKPKTEIPPHSTGESPRPRDVPSNPHRGSTIDPSYPTSIPETKSETQKLPFAPTVTKSIGSNFDAYAEEIYFSNRRLSAVKGFDVIFSMPSNEVEYQNIFGKLNQSQLEKFVSLRQDLTQNLPDNVKFLTTSGTEYMSSDENNRRIIVVIGHNDGEKILFPDGSSSTFQELDQIAIKKHQLIIYLSCNASAYTSNPSPGYNLYYSDAVILTNMLNTALFQRGWKKKNNIKTESFAETAQQVIDRFGVEQRVQTNMKIVAYSAVGGGTVVGFWFYNKE